MVRCAWIGWLLVVGCSGEGDGGGDSGTPAPATAVDAGCLDVPCDLPGVGASAWALCEEATAAAADTTMTWDETRHLRGSGGIASGIVMRCGSSVLVEEDCEDLCRDGGLGSPYFNSYASDCTCLKNTDDVGSLAESLATAACGDTDADVGVGVYATTPGSSDLTYGGSIVCGSGAAETCEAAVDVASDALGASYSEATDVDGVCTLTGP